MKKFRFLICNMAAIGFMVTAAFSQGKIDVKAPIPIDPNVKVGKLDNGLVYYIRKNAKPEQRIEYRLIVNAGSVLENDGQQGLAHFTEHMAFNGTKNFPKNELVNFLQKIGVKFGADINAYTSFDETVYMLQVPSDKPDLVEKGYQVIEDWAHNFTFDGKEIDKERGVITEEWRLGLGAEDRMMKKYLPLILTGSKYAERLPIGKIEIIQSFKHDTIRKFYYDWYRPNLMAVAIVGDIDVSEAEKKIKEHFSGLVNPQNERTRPTFSIPDNKEPLISICTDKEATGTGIEVLYKHPKKIAKNIEDYRDIVMQNLFTGMLDQRFNEIARNADAPFIYAGSYYGGFLARNADAFGLSGAIKENQILKGFESLLVETERVKRFGFTQTELDRMKDQLLSDYEQKAKEADKTESERLAGEYVRHYLQQEPIPGIKNEFKYAKKFMNDIKLEELNALAKEWVSDENICVIITAPQKDNIKIPVEKDLTGLISKVKTEELTAWVDNFKSTPLVEEDLKGTGITSRVENKELGFTEITLQNGVQIIIKPTDFKNDEILFTSFSPGGTSLCPESDFMSCDYSNAIVSESGVGNFDQNQLEKKLKGKVVNLGPYITDLKQGFTGNCAPKDFETLLQLTYLYFKHPRKDTAAFNGFMSKMRNQYKFVGASPIYAFIDTLVKLSVQNDPRVVVIPSEAQLNSVDLEKAYAFYKERFSDCSQYKFFIVGNVDVDSITPLLQKYLGSLPFTKHRDAWKDVSRDFPSQTINLTVKKGTEPKSMVGIIMSENIEWNDNNKLYLRMVKEIISIKLVEVIREEMSGVYSPMIQSEMAKYPKSKFSMMVMFGCNPKNTEKLTKAVFKIIDKIEKKGPTDIDLKKAKEALVREREVDIKTNKFWLSKLENAYFNGEELKSISDFKDRVEAVSINELKEFTDKYIKKDHYVRVVLKPEDKK